MNFTLPIRQRLYYKPGTITTLPFNIALEILRYLPLEIASDTKLLIHMFPYSCPGRLQMSRLDPRYVFDDLVPDTTEMMKVMLASGVILSGSRALEYYLPGTSTPTSDWDFYCTSNYVYTNYFVHWLQSQGLTVNEPIMSEDNRNAYAYVGFNFITGTIKYKGKSNNIQIICKEECMLSPENLLSFDLSICQCFIAGYGAVSMNSYLTRYYKAVCWVDCTMTHKERRMKYSSRNISMHSSMEDIINMSNVPLIKPTSNIIRSIGDANCCCIPYNNMSFYDDDYGMAADVLYKEVHDMIWRETTRTGIITIDWNLRWNWGNTYRQHNIIRHLKVVSERIVDYVFSIKELHVNIDYYGVFDTMEYTSVPGHVSIKFDNDRRIHVVLHRERFPGLTDHIHNWSDPYTIEARQELCMHIGNLPSSIIQRMMSKYSDCINIFPRL